LIERITVAQVIAKMVLPAPDQTKPRRDERREAA
jgi:hypothetical protein